MTKSEAMEQALEMELAEFGALQELCKRRNINLHDFLMYQIEQHLLDIRYTMELGKDE